MKWFQFSKVVFQKNEVEYFYIKNGGGEGEMWKKFKRGKSQVISTLRER